MCSSDLSCRGLQSPVWWPGSASSQSLTQAGRMQSACSACSPSLLSHFLRLSHPICCRRPPSRTRPLRKRTRGDEAAFQQGIKSGTEETSAEGKGVRIAAFRGESRRGVRRSTNRATKLREPGRTNRKSKAREQPVRAPANGRTALSHPGGRANAVVPRGWSIPLLAGITFPPARRRSRSL